MVSKGFAAYQAEDISYTIQKEINSGSAIKSLGISSIDEIHKNNPKIKRWIDGLNKSTILDEFIPYTRDANNIYIRIEVNDQLVYSNEEREIKELSGFYKDTEAIKPILDSNNNQIGKIKVRVNPHVLLGILLPIFIMIILLSMIALIIAKILSMFLVIPIINPLTQLEKKVKAIAEGDQETAANTKLILKRPLREIESLADSTNGIMKKLNGYNAELEAQNDELMASKLQIQKQQSQLVQSEKMASVGQLTAAITHEINTPIGAINSNVQLGDMLLNELINHSSAQIDDELSSMLSQLKEVNDVNLVACSRIIEIIKSLKSFSRLDQAEFQEASINEGIKSVLVLTNYLLKGRITVHEEIGDIPPIKCFPGQLNQVFMNIIVNAAQAIEGEGEIFISTYQRERYINITIKDTGTGIKEENISKLFDPGFTTKGVGVGLGLGLYISYNIIQNHKGEISVVSTLGKGTEFIIKIPNDNEKP